MAGNLAVWLTMLAVTGFTWQWLLDHYRPRLRWSLRSMLAAIAIGAAICAWFAVLRDRATEQDALLESFVNRRCVYFERWGPKWLDLFGADRYRRRIVAAEVDTFQQNDEFFERLARLRSVKLLDINPLNIDEPIVFTDRMAASLGEMRQLRVLVVDCSGDKRSETKTAIRECLMAIGKLDKLERLNLTMWEEDIHELARLAGLANLKTLSLEVFNDDSDETKRAEVARTLPRLPPLPCLESLDLEWEIGDEVLGRLAGLPRLRSLNLSITSVTDVGLAKLVPLDSLEELAISKDVATATAFKSLAALKNLRAIHIGGLAGTRIESVEDELARRAEFVFGDADNVEQLRSAALVLDDGHELPVLSAELNDLEISLAELRRSHPRIVIDADYGGFMERIDRLQPRWHNGSAIDSDMRRLLN
ncbi:MAG TPA: hypothetical protein VJ783_11455 [Pirellulales bacterium]|nr:hypothetical protein [Pirellulales bacterium]